ncbi:MAG: phosphatase PAP2 family protein [Acidimicrobiia bacterium]
MSSTPTSGDLSPVAPASKRWRYGWLGEIAVMAALYQLYDVARAPVAGGTAESMANANGIVDAEKWLGIYWERAIQQAFLDSDWFIVFWNWWYGTVHFVIPAAALVLLYRKTPARYVRWRNTLLAMWAVGVLTFWLYPLMPPRLMPPGYDCARGERCIVDTAVGYTNLGPRMELDFKPNGEPTDATLDQYANPYAAMPSFHVGWSTFTALAIWPFLRRRWMKIAAVAYLGGVIFCITVTGNHWLLDVPGGWLVVGAGYAVAVAFERAGAAARRGRLRARPASASAGAG